VQLASCGEMRRTVDIDVVLDEAVNAAAMTFDTEAKGRELRTLAVTDDTGTTLATLTFASSGALVQIELLDAVRQLPVSLRTGQN
jgi:hypothetical protein